MVRIRQVRIQNFRGIKEFNWNPGSGLNCLIGPGDSGKSTILDAIDMCIGARRSVSFCDADFHRMDEAESIEVAVTVGELPDHLKSMEAYGPYLRGYDKATGKVDDEPDAATEVVLTMVLCVGADLDPNWTLKSERAGPTPRYLTWADRDRIAPTRMSGGGQHLGWRRGSILNRISDEKADASAALAEAARHARKSFGDHAAEKLANTLKTVADNAKELGVAVGDDLKAMLDAQSISFGNGTISVHDKHGIPLSALGTGSTRLLTAGLQRSAAKESSIVLVDELEHGLEPHRIMRLLGSLGAKESVPPLQGFLTTHSPVVVRELSVAQLQIVRRYEDEHFVVGVPNEAQGIARTNPEAFLAESILVCEGASEVGFMRGFERHVSKKAGKSLFAAGLALLDAGGCSRIYSRALPLQKLGYRIAVLRDDDAQPAEPDEAAFAESGGRVFKWRKDMALEDELFDSLSNDGVVKLMLRAIELIGEGVVAAQLSSFSDGKVTIADCHRRQDAEVRALLATASKSKGNSWFKNVTDYDDLTYDIVVPDLPNCSAQFRAALIEVVKWARNGH